MTVHLSLAERVPDKRFFHQYIPREMPGTELSDVEIIETAVRNQLNVLMEGPTGPGKTSAYLATFAKNDWPLGIVNLNGMSTVEDLVGQIVPIDGSPEETRELADAVVTAKIKALEAQHGTKDAQKFLDAKRELLRAEFELDLAYREGANGLVWKNGLLVDLMLGDPDFEHTGFLADEVNFSPAKIAAVINSVTDDRRQLVLVQHKGETIQAHPGFHIGAAMNPYYEGTRPLNRALRDRFDLKLPYDYDEKIEKQIIGDDRLIALAKKLRHMHKDEEVQTPTSTRTLKQYIKNREIFGNAFAIEAFVANYDESERSAVREASELHLKRGGKGTKGAVPKVPDADQML